MTTDGTTAEDRLAKLGSPVELVPRQRLIVG
jgi:hypothetical protein